MVEKHMNIDCSLEENFWSSKRWFPKKTHLGPSEVNSCVALKKEDM